MTPTALLILFAISILLGIIIATAKQQKKEKIETTEDKENYQYIMHKELFTRNELAFLKKLYPTAKKMGYIVFGKVRLADLIEPRKGAQNWQTAFNKIRAKHVDFVLCDKLLRPVLVIELDDSSHDRPDRIQRDAFVDEALTSAKMPILHMRESNDLSQKISQALAK